VVVVVASCTSFTDERRLFSVLDTFFLDFTVSIGMLAHVLYDKQERDTTHSMTTGVCLAVEAHLQAGLYKSKSSPLQKERKRKG
jgi:hypothetical protein